MRSRPQWGYLAWLALAGLLVVRCNSESFSGGSGKTPGPVAPAPTATPVATPNANPAPAHSPPASPTHDSEDLGNAASAAKVTPPAPPQPPPPAPVPSTPKSLDVDCSSSQYQPCQTTQDCAQFTVPAGGKITAVTLKDQHSVASCDQNSSWSFDATSLACWAGCRGTFTVTYLPASP